MVGGRVRTITRHGHCLLNSLLHVLSLGFLLTALALIVTPATALAATCTNPPSTGDAITNFASDVEVEPDSSVVVRETIQLNVVSREISRGISRDLPNRYQDPRGHVHVVDVKVVEVRRDGQSEAYSTTSTPNGIRLTIGSPATVLQPGKYTYTLSYRVAGALGFFPDRDQLYWPATGTRWSVPIDCATVAVRLPFDVPRSGIQADGWLGSEADPARHLTNTIDQAGVITYVVDGPLGQEYGVLVSVAFPRGHVQEPVVVGQSLPVIGEGRTAPAAMLGLFLVAAYGAFASWRVRRWPKSVEVAAVARPPHGLSPPAARFLAIADYDARTLVATIISLAVKGYLTIREESLPAVAALPPSNQSHGSVSYLLIRNEATAPRARVTPEEGGALAELFGDSGTLYVGRSAYRQIRRAHEEIKRLVGALYEGRYFTTHSGYLIPALLVGLLTIAATTVSETNRASLALGSAAIWLVVVASLVYGTTFVLGMILLANRFRTARQWAIFSVVGLLAFLVPLAAVYFVLAIVARTSPVVVVLLGALGVGLAALRKFLATPTRDGRIGRDQLDGFKAFLHGVALRTDGEGQEQGWRATWEAYLPYAVALDADEGWFSPLANTVSTALGEKQCGESVRIWYENTGDSANLTASPSTLAESLCAAVNDALQGPRSSADNIADGSLFDAKGRGADEPKPPTT